MRATSLFLTFISLCLLAGSAPAASYPNASVTDSVCVNADWGLTQTQADLLHAAGVSAVRVAFSGHSIVDPATGNYDWDRLDHVVGVCAQAGLRVFATLDGVDEYDWPIQYIGAYGNDSWFTGTATSRLGTYTGNTAGYLGTTEYRQTFDVMTNDTVTHYTQLANSLKTNHKDLNGVQVNVASSWNPNFTWELWNEPNYGNFWPGNSANDYMKLAMGVNGDGTQDGMYGTVNVTKGALQIIRDAAHSAAGPGSNVTIIAPALATQQGDFNPADYPTALSYLKTCLSFRKDNQGLLDKADGLGVHFYRGDNPETVTSTSLGDSPTAAEIDADFTANPNYAAIRKLMTTYGGSNGSTVPILSSECGYVSDGVGGAQTQADYLQRMFLTNMSQGSQLNNWYALGDDGAGNFGLVTDLWGSLTPKPAYDAMQELTASLRGETFYQKLYNRHDDVWLLEFTGSGQDTLVAWSTQDGGRRVYLSAWGGWLDLTGSPTFINPSTVPEPGTCVLLVTGLLGLLAYTWRRRK